MNEQYLQNLLKKHESGTLTPLEQAQLDRWYLDFAKQSTQQPSEKDLTDSKMQLRANLPLAYPKPAKKLRLPVSIAASILVLISVGLYLYNVPAAHQRGIVYANDVAPGKNSATLTLADGRVIALGNNVRGDLAKQQGVRISKTADGKLVYQVSGTAGNQVQYNTLTTGNGEQIEIVLPDGSAVWLNAASQLKFPTTFAKQSNRRVELIGEGYFEVFKNKSMPFIVHTDQQEVQVLGTHFNVNSYAEEAIAKTTLLEGSVLVNQKTILIPGEQASGSGLQISKSITDTERAIAWKNNKFMFEGEHIEEIMKQVKRWYNVDVLYSGDIPKELFTGSVSRFDKISKVLSILELTGNVHFKIEGRRITVMK